MKLLLLLLSILLISGVYASSYSIEFNQIGDKLVVKENNDGNQTSFVTQEGLNKINGGYYFIKRIGASNNFDNLSVKLNLEQGVVAKENQIFPQNYRVESDGQTINLVWDYSNVKNGDKLAFFVELQDSNQDFQYWWIVILFIIIIAGLYAWFKFFKDKKANIGKYLLDDEKKVILELKKADRHELWQKKIQDNLGFSKAKTSRLMRNLESRDLIEKIPMGNTNKIRLK